MELADVLDTPDYTVEVLGWKNLLGLIAGHADVNFGGLSLPVAQRCLGSAAVKECERANAANNQREQQDVYELGFHLQETLGIAEQFRSGDGERKTLLTRQIAFEPFPASVLLGPAVICGSGGPL
jgi:hypothetical protein